MVAFESSQNEFAANSPWDRLRLVSVTKEGDTYCVGGLQGRSTDVVPPRATGAKSWQQGGHVGHGVTLWKSNIARENHYLKQVNQLEMGHFE